MSAIFINNKKWFYTTNLEYRAWIPRSQSYHIGHFLTAPYNHLLITYKRLLLHLKKCDENLKTKSCGNPNFTRIIYYLRAIYLGLFKSVFVCISNQTEKYTNK